MSAASYNRGSRMLSANIDAQMRAPEFQMMDELNALPKHAHAAKPFGPILFACDGKNWWALDPSKGFSGFGYCYATLRAAVRFWRVAITGYRNGAFYAEVTP